MLKLSSSICKTDDELRRSIYSMYQNGKNLDGKFLCKDGEVLFNVSVLSAMSQVLAVHSNQDDIFILSDFRRDTIEIVMKVLHGFPDPVNIDDPSICQEIIAFLNSLSIRLPEKISSSNKRVKRESTFEDSRSKKRQRSIFYTSKQFTDWSHNNSQEEKKRCNAEKSTFLRINYEKSETEKQSQNDKSEKIREKANTEVTIEDTIASDSVIKNEMDQDNEIQVDDDATISNEPLNSGAENNCDVENAMFVSELEAEKIASSYMVFQTNLFGRIEYRCQVCNFISGQPSLVSDHVILIHTNVYAFSCEFCDAQFQVRIQLNEHLQKHHDYKQKSDQEENSEVNEELGSVIDVTDEIDEHDVDDISGTEELEVDDSVRRQSMLFNFESIIETKQSADGQEQVFVKGALHPLLKHNHSTLEKIFNAKFMTKEEAVASLAENYFKNSQNNKYECTVCQGNYKVDKISLIQSHIFKHFNIYIYRCEYCHDVFRTKNGLDLHISNHQKTKSPQKEEKMIGSYHLKGKNEFISADRAKPIIESYFKRLSTKQGSFECLVCSDVFSGYHKVYNHCLRAHLRIHSYSCEDCAETFKWSPDLTKHKREYHGLIDFKQELKTDFPGLIDLSILSANDLQGHSIDFKQERSIRGKNLSYNSYIDQWECDFCNLKSQYRATIQNHVYSVHYEVYTCSCSVCNQKFHNLNQLNVHSKNIHNKVKKKNDLELLAVDESIEYDKLTSPVYLGESKAKQAASKYMIQDKDSKSWACVLCEVKRGQSKVLENHVLNKHLRNVFLYRCDECGKEFRNNKSLFEEHKLSHSQGKIGCEECASKPTTSKKAPSLFNKRTLQVHMKTFHSPGTFICKRTRCGIENEPAFKTKHELMVHEVTCHDKKEIKVFSCDICEYQFPTRSRLKKHVKRCEAGRSRTLFRKQISDILEYLGKGSYKCTFCDQQFHPHPKDPLKAGLPEARNHVVTKHGMRHMRKLKMQWLGDPASVDKSVTYKDKSSIWFQKLKDIEKVNTQAEESLINQENTKDGNLTESYRTLMEALSHTKTPVNTSRDIHNVEVDTVDGVAVNLDEEEHKFPSEIGNVDHIQLHQVGEDASTLHHLHNVDVHHHQVQEFEVEEIEEADQINSEIEGAVQMNSVIFHVIQHEAGSIQVEKGKCDGSGILIQPLHHRQTSSAVSG